MVFLKPRQSTALFGWWNPRPVLAWGDVLSLKLSVDALVACGLTATEISMLQPDPAEWVKHAGGELRHARHLRANPFIYFRADLADVLSMKLSLDEMIRMDITHAQLVSVGMTPETEALFKLDETEWTMLGKGDSL